MRDTRDNEAEILDIARRRLRRCVEAEADNRRRALEDLKFASGDQWPTQIRRQRQLERRPCLTLNKTGQYIRSVVNDAKQNPPAIKVRPAGEGADEEVAEVFNGLIRLIESRSNAQDAYLWALDRAVRCGVGYWRIITDYVADDSFEQEIRIRRIRNPFSVYLDPDAEDPAGSDAKFGFITAWIDRDEFEERYGTDRVSEIDNLGAGDREHWTDGERIRIAEYYALETVERELLLLADGSTVWRDASGDVSDEAIIRSRKVRTRRCIWRKITASHVLEETEWLSSFVPIIRVVGDEDDIEGEVTYKGMIRDLMDSQRMYNYWITSATEMIALAPKAPFIGAEGQFDGYEDKWGSANQVSYPYLEYRPVTIGNQLAPPPERQPFAGPPTGILNMAAIATDDMKAITGVYDAGLGAASNEKSGRAILARQRQSDNATFHYIDNLTKAIKHTGRILVEMIPKIYDTPRVLRIIGDDDSEKEVMLQPGIAQQAGTPVVEQPADDDRQAVQKLYDITVGRYDVVVTVGPSYATKRVEAADSMMQFVQAVPTAGGAVMDLIAKNMDWPGAEEIAERLKKLLPPELRDEAEQAGVPPQMVDQIVQQAVAQAQAEMMQNIEMQAKQAELQFKQQEIGIKEYEAETKRLKAEIDALKAQGGADVERVKDLVAEALAEFIAESHGVAANG